LIWPLFLIKMMDSPYPSWKFQGSEDTAWFPGLGTVSTERPQQLNPFVWEWLFWIQDELFTKCCHFELNVFTCYVVWPQTKVVGSSADLISCSSQGQQHTQRVDARMGSTVTGFRC
jgi:hypothetical protein